jgi:hypothetical protein
VQTKRIIHILQVLANFRTREPFQTIIEILQVIGIGAWIIIDIWPDFFKAPDIAPGWVALPNGPMIYLGLFFIFDAMLILNSKLCHIFFQDVPTDTSNNSTKVDRVQKSRTDFVECERLLGAQHPQTLNQQMKLALSYLQDHQHELAISTCTDVARKTKEAFGISNDLTLASEDLLSRAILSDYVHNHRESIDADHVTLFKKIVAQRTTTLPPGNIHTLRSEDCLMHALVINSSGDRTLKDIAKVVGNDNRKQIIRLDRLEVRRFDVSAAARACITFLLDCILIMVAAPFRALRVMRPLMILRRMAVATEKEPNWRFPLVSRETFLMSQLGVLLVYSLGLTVLAIGDLIYVAENLYTQRLEHLKIDIKSLPDGIWYSIQQITLVGSNHEVQSVSGKVYTVLLLFMGLGIIGLFGMLFQRIFGMSYLPKQVNHKDLLEQSK